jgi:hypothetical protein
LTRSRHFSPRRYSERGSILPFTRYSGRGAGGEGVRPAPRPRLSFLFWQSAQPTLTPDRPRMGERDRSPENPLRKCAAGAEEKRASLPNPPVREPGGVPCPRRSACPARARFPRPPCLPISPVAVASPRVVAGIKSPASRFAPIARKPSPRGAATRWSSGRKKSRASSADGWARCAL